MDAALYVDLKYIQYTNKSGKHKLDWCCKKQTKTDEVRLTDFNWLLASSETINWVSRNCLSQYGKEAFQHLRFLITYIPISKHSFYLMALSNEGTISTSSHLKEAR